MSERGQNREVQGHRGWDKMLLIVFNQLNANAISETKDLISKIMEISLFSEMKCALSPDLYVL